MTVQLRSEVHMVYRNHMTDNCLQSSANVRIDCCLFRHIIMLELLELLYV